MKRVKRILTIILLQTIVFHIVMITRPIPFDMKTLDNSLADYTQLTKEGIEYSGKKKSLQKNNVQIEDLFSIEQMKGNRDIQLTISVAGDFTIGYDESYGYQNSFADEVNRQNQNYRYFLKHAADFFSEDDLTLVNLETTFTTTNDKADKLFSFKGNPEWVDILKFGSIEAVNLANNHTYDYLDRGYKDTIETLHKANISFFGNGEPYVFNLKGIRVGILGYNGWEFSSKMKAIIKDDLNYLKQFSDLIVVSFHWGKEGNYYPSITQTQLGHYTIDLGADLVFGHHPHVIQGVEYYKGKYIVYSLGNFLFGGNKNPLDKDSFIFQQAFYFNREKRLMKTEDVTLIPFSISSVSYRNNYQPILLTGLEGERVARKVKTLSSIFK